MKHQKAPDSGAFLLFADWTVKPNLITSDIEKLGVRNGQPSKLIASV